MSAHETVLVCGGRDFNHYETVRRILDALLTNNPIRLIVHGGCSGADTLASRWAQERGISQAVEKPDWKGNGRAAGPMRNQIMVEKYSPTLVVAFPGGRGTADMLKRARKANVVVVHVSGKVTDEADDSDRL